MARHKVGLLITKALKDDGHSQAWLDKKLKVERSTVTKWLSKGGNRISCGNLQRITERLNIDKKKLFELATETWPKHKHEYTDCLQQNPQQIKEGKPKANIFVRPHIGEVTSNDCPIYYQLNLGKEENIPSKPNEQDKPIYEYPMWKERDSDWRKRFIETPAEKVLSNWLGQPGIHAIVGEPGGGKSTLLRFWANELINRSTPTKRYLPLLIPLREVKKSGIVGFFKRQNKSYEPIFDVKPYLRSDYDKKEIQVVWLFDGLDELPKDLQEIWLEQIKNREADCCIVTCRTALWNSDYRIIFGEPHFLMGLYPKDQKTFLQQLAKEWREGKRQIAGFEQANDDWVSELYSQLHKNHNLKRLAGSPLLLTLIARTNKPGHIKLPAKRTDFYYLAFKELLQQRTDEVNPIPYINVLAQLAYEISKDELVAEFSEVDFDRHTAQLSQKQIAILKASNIVKYNRNNHNYQWLHQTFQEWFLAEYLHNNGGLLKAVETYWQNPIYHEMLALLWDLSDDNEHLVTSKYLIGQGCQKIANTQNKHRSGLGTLLRIINSSGDNPAGKVFDLLWEHTTKTPSRKKIIAISKTTPQTLLLELVGSNEVFILRSLVKNPNTPPEALSKLAGSKDKSVLGNLVKKPDITPEIFSILADTKDEYVLKSLASNRETPPEVLSKLAGSKDKSVLGNLVENPNITPEIFSILADTKDEYVLESLASNHKTPPEVLSKLAGSNNEDVLESLASNHKTPPEIFSILADTKDEYVLESLASNHKTPPEILSKLAGSKDNPVLRSLARNHKTPPEILSILASSKYKPVLRGLASNHKTPPEILSILASSKNKYVLRGLVENPTTPPEILSKLAGSNNEDVLESLARNRNTSPEILSKLAGSKDKYVLRSLARNRKTPPEVLSKLAGSKDNPVLRSLARNPNTPPEILSKLAGSNNEDVLESLASNHKTPPEILSKLAGSKDNPVPRSLASNPNTPPETLFKFASSKDIVVLWHLVKNPNIAPEILIKLADCNYESVLWGLAENPNITPEILTKFTNTDSENVLRRLEENPSTCLEWF